MDCKRLSDGKQVFMKRVGPHSGERKLAEFFSSNEHQENPANHCIKLLEVLVDDCDDYHCFLVMPLVRMFDSPDFVSVDEVIDFMRQTLEVSILSSLSHFLTIIYLYRDSFSCTARTLLIGTSPEASLDVRQLDSRSAS